MTLTNLEVAQTTRLRPLSAVAELLGLPRDAVQPWGPHAAKVDPALAPGRGRGKLVLVTAMNPTPAGEGKTTTVVGLTQGLMKQGESACAVLREPSLGPVFGVKGGGCGGGRSQVLPMEEINLHFTGGLHAVSAAHNLLAAMVDNHLHHGNALGLEEREILWPRVLDMNDRALRDVVIGLGGRTGGVPRQSRFDITAASEVMAILALARDLADLRERLGRIVVGFTRGKSPRPVTAAELKAHGAMALLLQHALKPNLVQTVEGAPALVHTGPFGNIAHGCPSVQAIELSMRHAAYTVVEAGFGADLGAQKFLDIVCPITGDWPDAVVLVATVRACKVHGGVPPAKVAEPDPEAVTRGLANVVAHVEGLRRRGLEPVVALNRRAGDPEVDERAFREGLAARGIAVVDADPYSGGGEGCLELATAVREASRRKRPEPRHPYGAADRLPEKLAGIVRMVSGGDGATLESAARASLERFEAAGYGGLAPCVARTQYSLSDDPKALGRPTGFTVIIRQIRLLAGAGFLVALAGDILTMPGLGAKPAAEGIDVAPDGTAIGLY